jgi:hypothetical protein
MAPTSSGSVQGFFSIITKIVKRQQGMSSPAFVPLEAGLSSPLERSKCGDVNDGSKSTISRGSD